MLDIGSTSTAAKAGVMIRETLDNNARHASTLVTPNATRAFIWRLGTNSRSGAASEANAISEPWLRMVRSGTSFSSFVSDDGVNWSQIGSTQTISMSTTATYYVGLAVASGSTETLSNALFDNVTITGGRPQNLAASVAGSQVQLTWDAVTGAAGYHVKRSTTSGGPYATIGVLTTNDFIDTPTADGTVYYYVVSATAGATGESADSDQVVARPEMPMPEIPQGLNVATDGSIQIDLTWTASANASGYIIKRGSSPSGPFTQIGTSATTSYNDTAVVLGATYSYVVVATNGDQQSGESAVGSITLSVERVWNNSAGTGIWNTADANWNGATWADGGDSIFAHTAGAETITVSGTRSAVEVKVGNGSNNANYTFAGSGGASLSAASFTVQGAGANDPGLGTSMLNDLAVSTTGDLRVGRWDLVIGGSSVVNIGGQLRSTSDGNGLGDWGRVTLQDNANVTVSGGVDSSGSVWGLTLNGGTLATPGIRAAENSYGAGSRVTFNGTTVVATEENASFVTVDATNQAYVGSGGAMFDTNGHDIGIGVTLTGSGPLIKSGGGALTLTALNTYIGGTIVNGGKLVVAGSGGSGRLQGELTVNANGTVETTGDGTGLGFAGQLSKLTINHGGLITSSGNNHLWQIGGGVNLAGGTLQSNDGVSAPDGAFLEWGNTAVYATGDNTSTIAGRIRIRSDSNPTLTFDVADGAQATDLLVSAAITEYGPSGITKTGDGTMVLDAVNSYTGPTAVNNGTLRVNGSTTSATTVSGTAILGGDGTIDSAITVDPGGTLAPGSSIGTLTAASAAINGTLAIELDGATADRLDVSGNLDITNATLALTGTLTADEIIIASYGTLSGSAFASITGLPEGYEVDSSGNQIRLVVSAVPTFVSWMDDNYPALSDKTPTGDPDNDGMENALEYILGGGQLQPQDFPV
ncbi:MAG: autotransporter-associated beta strand repeat-containing protein, partial [Verrucomicrobiae bacterium]|nr:autotransporter-associated beta strand repeat-containing protein [Verrucomicrobiae bacterium]